MLYLIYFIVLLFCFSMFRVKKEKKIAILFLSTICFESVVVHFLPFGGAIYLLSISFCLSEMRQIKKNLLSVKRSILYTLMIIVIVGVIISIINSPHYSTPFQWIRYVIIEIIGKYFALCYGFLSIKSEKELTPTMKYSYYGLLVLTALGILNLVTKNAIFLDIVSQFRESSQSTTSAGSMFTDSERFRVQAMLYNPFNYGYICIMLIFLHTWGHTKGILKSSRYYTSVCCSLFGIYFCGCRTVVLCFLVGVTVYILTKFDMKRRFRYFLMTFFIGVFSYLFIPAVQLKVDEMTSMFQFESSIGGSSLSMREGQILAVMYHIKDNLLFGRGKDYFLIDLGWREGRAALVDSDLYGLEGIYMSVLLEKGFVGLALYLTFYIILSIFIIKNRKKDKDNYAISISIIAVYFTFANATGELSSVYPTLLLTGFLIKLTYISNRYNEIQHNNPRL